MKNVLVTGGAGFIGAYLVKKLIQQGLNVTIVDNLRDVGGVSYIHPKAHFIKADICDLGMYAQLNHLNLDTVFHLAAQSAGEPSYEDPKLDIMTNCYGTYLISKFCKENEISRFIYTSTVAVYGNSEGIISENTSINPDSIYGISKYSGEMFVRQLFNNSKTNYTIFRVFNTYGPGENLDYSKKGMVSIYLGYVWKNQPILVKGSLDRFRDLTYIEDNVNAIFKCCDKPISFGEVYNLSSGKKTYVRELINCILEVFNKSANYEVKELPSTPGDSFGYHSNISKIKKHLDWEPSVEIMDGLKKYYDWVKNINVNDNLKDKHPFMLQNDNKS